MHSYTTLSYYNVHIYILYIHAYIHAYICTYIQTVTLPFYLYLQKCRHTHTYIHTHKYTHTHTHTYTHTYTHTHTHTYIHTHIILRRCVWSDNIYRSSRCDNRLDIGCQCFQHRHLPTISHRRVFDLLSEFVNQDLPAHIQRLYPPYIHIAQYPSQR